MIYLDLLIIANTYNRKV